jgi:hypothetical protein
MSVFAGLLSYLAGGWRSNPAAAVGALIGLIGGYALQGPVGALVGFVLGAVVGWAAGGLMKPKPPA